MTIFMHTTELFSVRERQGRGTGDRRKEDKKGRNTKKRK